MNNKNAIPGFKIVIPARYASSRFPGKPLKLIAGKPMIQHTYERAMQSQAQEVVIATDDQRIGEAASRFCNNIIMTSEDHVSGTERLAEVVEMRKWSEDTIVVNVQGDEPLVSPKHIELVARALEHNAKAGMATLAAPIQSLTDVFDTNIVKVVMDHDGYALYFSRAVIPWSRDAFTMAAVEHQGVKNLADDGNWYRHIGMYAYRAGTLKQYLTLNPTMLEKTESLEQLRVLYNGIAIHVSIVHEPPGQGVDVQADIAKVEQLLKSSH